MAISNPVLSQVTKEAQQGQVPGQAGFAYDEGRQAYAQAAAGNAAAVDMAALRTPTGPATGVGARLTLNDVIVKTAIMFVVLLAGAAVGWTTSYSMPWLWIVAMFVALGLGLFMAFKRSASPVLALAYALAEGVMLGGISRWYSDYAAANGNGNIVGQAVLGTLVAFGVMLAVYQTGLIKVNGKFVKIMMVAMISYAVIALVSFVAAIFGVGQGWGFYGVSGIGLALMLFAVVLAAFSLLLDFEMIKQAIAYGLPERESWRMAFGLMVTLVWLYLEILRLLAITSRN